MSLKSEPSTLALSSSARGTPETEPSGVRRFGFHEAMSGAPISLPTTLEALRAQGGEVASVVGELLEHCQLRYDDINANARGVVFVGWSPWRWAPLPNAAQRHVGEADRAWRSFNELAEQAVRATAPKRASPLEQADNLLRRIID